MTLASEEEPRPPDPCWQAGKKRPYPFNTCNATSTPKRFRNNSGNPALHYSVNNNDSPNSTSLVSYQQINVNIHQKHKVESPVCLENQKQSQHKWPLPKGAVVTDAIKGQGKITEYFKTQIKPTPIVQKSSPTISVGSRKEKTKSVTKDGINKFFRIISGSKELSVLTSDELTEHTPDSDERSLDIQCEANTVSLELNGTSPQIENKTEILPANTESTSSAPLSPILSAPRVIRFPVAQRPGLHTEPESARCCWSQCELDFRCGSKLLEHLQNQHVNTQLRGGGGDGHYVCLWVGCKVYGRTSCSVSWLEHHVLSHGGSKPFRCIFDDCGQRFGSKGSLQRHVNTHFNNSSGVSGNNANGNGTKRNTEVIPNKLFKKNGKKLRYRRQPWSARMFDYIDTGMMEGLQHRLLTFSQQQFNNISTSEQEQELATGNCLALRSKIIGQRTELDGTNRFLVRWTPEDILPEEWLKREDIQATKVVSLSQLPPASCATLHQTMLPPKVKVTRKPRKPRVS